VRRAGVLAALLAPALVACGGGGPSVAPPAAPPPAVVPPVVAPETIRDRPSDDPDPLPLVEPVEHTEADGLLDSRWLDHPTLESRVDFWIDHWQGRGSSDFVRYLERMGLYEGAVDGTIEEMGLPPSLRYLPIVESGYNPFAVSRVGATGLWQFMTPTARYLGLRVTPLMDERRDPVVSTRVALEYLSTLYDQFDSWLLALAAYNAGPGRVGGLIRRHAGAGEQGDSIFRVIHPHLPPETRDFLPRFVAASRMAADPEIYGFGDVQPGEPLGFDEVSVPDATSLDVIARSAGVPLAEIERLNPQFLRGMTPRGAATTLRVPADHGERFAAAYAEVPPGERVTFVEHHVASGETLGHIALRYGIRVPELQAANPRVDPRRLQIGQRLVVPTVPGSGRGGAVPVVLAGGGAAGSYQVAPGDSLWSIATRHDVAVGALARANGLPLDAVIHPGDRITIPAR
jgi:membrane-bound lytic murein transglycosylase D